MRAIRTRTVTVAVIVACGVGAIAGAIAGSAGASSGKVQRCEKIAVKGQRWGVYVAKGKVACGTAGRVLKGVLAGKGTPLVGNGTGGSSYDGWVCPYDQMGIVTCEHGSKPVAHPSREIFGLNCSTETGEPACPARSEP